jgi:hypothetical protein
MCDRRSSVCDATAGGVCVAMDATCDDPSPVCGCDGVTYASDCARVAAGVAVAMPGACPGSCWTHDECAAGFFCETPAGDCGESQAGTCVPMNDPACAVCGDYATDRVCGCDGMTYASDCARRAAGASKLGPGWCW